VVSGAQRLQVVLPAEYADGTLATALSARMRQVPAHIVGLAHRARPGVARLMYVPFLFE
jgi:hypothetical protein